MKVIFLDIDGVLNTRYTPQRHRGFIGMHPELVERFNKLRARTGAKVVLSSTWRLAKDWKNTMAECGLDTEHFIDRTPHMPLTGGVEAMERGKEIQAWLNEHPDVEAYAILDDDSDMLPHQPHFKTSFYEGGLTEEVAERVAAHLGVMHT